VGDKGLDEKLNVRNIGSPYMDRGRLRASLKNPLQ
jgi:hypothetical protein